MRLFNNKPLKIFGLINVFFVSDGLYEPNILNELEMKDTQR